MNVLFVCTGNTCRSPMAEGLFNTKCEGRHRAVSCGLNAQAGEPATSEAVEAVRRLGADISTHRAQPVSADLVDGADRILCLSHNHLHALCALFPDAREKLTLLTREGIPDPYGLELAVYLETAACIDRAIDRLLEEL